MSGNEPASGYPRPRNNATCGDGNATMRFNNVAAGTYYYPVYMDPGTAFGPFVINVNAVACGG
ncbi:MAG: hypothetical protein IPG69_16765 [Flavobacteriales bacterium]|nr:hypothetical protein [Flavobacteriales bacterium]